MTKQENELLSGLMRLVNTRTQMAELTKVSNRLIFELRTDAPYAATKGTLDEYRVAAVDFESLDAYYGNSRCPFVRRSQVAIPPHGKSGQLVVDRKSYCESCGSPDNLHGHHEDYSRPNETVTLCARCHSRAHNGHSVWIFRVAE